MAKVASVIATATVEEIPKADLSVDNGFSNDSFMDKDDKKSGGNDGLLKNTTACTQDNAQVQQQSLTNVLKESGDTSLLMYAEF